MYFQALITAGFLGLASSSFGGAGPIPIGAEIGASNYGDFNSSVVQLRPAEPQAPATTTNIPIFKASDFPFVIIVPDDGTDKGGGWQAATVKLEFSLVRLMPPSVTKWKCPITIGMPIRHSTMGYISPKGAARRSVTVTNAVTLVMDFELPQGIFCDRFRSGVKVAFPLMYPGLGQTVSL